MLSKALITAAIVFIALASNGPGSLAAIDPAGRLDQRRVLVMPAPECEDGGAVEEQDQREEFHQTYPLSATGRVSLENINGGVQIKVWDRPALQLDAIKRAYKRERLAEATIEVNATEDIIRIKTEYPQQDQNFYGDERRYDNPAIVDYTLTVPRKAILESIELINGSLDIDGVEGSVKASSINGRVSARGLQGETKLSTVNGSLQAVFSQLEESKPISLQSVNGNVTLIIPSDSNASVRASTVHGSITNDFGLTVRHGEYVGHDLTGQIGNGGARIKLGNVNGGIRITHGQDGRRVSTSTSTVDSAQSKEDVKRELRDDMVGNIDAAAIAEEVKRTTREATRVAREAIREAERRDVVLREAQREVERAQAEVEREAQRQARDQMREQIRAEARAARDAAQAGTGARAGSGTGYGGGRYSAQETKSFPVSGAPRVTVNTFDGSIVVHGWEKPEVMYVATKRGDDDGDLKQISIRTEQQGSNLSIIASTENENGSASLEVYVPRQSSVHVTSDDGSLHLNGVSGDLTLRTGDGSVHVNDAGGQLHINTGDGSIRVANFDGQVDARTGDGSIALDGNLNAVTARTGDGSITLAVPPGSNFTVETNAAAADSITNEGLNMTEDVAPSQRVRRWKIGNGGKVFVLNTGDGRIVLRSR
ncbi:MAG TPA: DUF4097 family beta strand repeat-containing protein [Pyrinomonadaceae bacterium]|jgi:DUF4097 and DUF4098 domain-containing protein YvlB